ncbi:MAG: 50S ribosomal protein L10 [SAR202 cluster bacterium Io17-Chloro-G6]|nr:MAG: 50S ribosomal protein L10 [SAR202 cluster bacterium Io17-Chloro-G6]
MPTQQKRDRVQDIKDRLERSSIAMTASYSGISVNQMTELRRAMRGGGVDFTIVKNTLLALAAEEAQKPQLKDIVEGPTAIAFGYDDPADAAKAVADYIRTGRSALAIKGAVLGDGAQLSSSEVTQLASLPPKPQLLAMLLGQMQAPIAQLLTILNGPLQSLDNVLQARVRQMEEEGPAPTAEPAPEPEQPASETSAEGEDSPSAEAPTDEAAADQGPAAEAEEASDTEAEPEPAAEEAPPEEESIDEQEGETEPEPETESDGEAESE